MIDINLPEGMESVNPDELNKELEDLHIKPNDHDNEILPFQKLSGIQFELLVFLLLDQSDIISHDKTFLIKASGDKGRDVVCYKDGYINRIVQCKNYTNNISQPQILRELVKVALHNYLTPYWENKKLIYEIWTSSDFSEPSQTFIGEWPQSLNEDDLKSAFKETVEKYKSFENLSWNDCKSLIFPWKSGHLTVG